MPFTAGNLGIHTGDLLSTAFNDAVKTNVVLQRVGANNVVVVAIKDTDCDAPGAIYVPGDRFKFYGSIDVLGGNRVKNCEWETIVRSVDTGLFNCATCKGAFITHHKPLAKIALARSRKLKISWR